MARTPNRLAEQGDRVFDEVCSDVRRPTQRALRAFCASLLIDAASPPVHSVWFQAIDPTDRQRGPIASNLLEIQLFW